MSKSTRTYRKNTHHFFDELVTFLCSLAGVLITIEAFNSNGQTKSVNDPNYYIQFSGQTIGMKLTWYPNDAFKFISENDWPNEIILHQDLDHPKAPSFEISTTGFIGIQTINLQSAFIRYYESNKFTLESKIGSDPYKWPVAYNSKKKNYHIPSIPNSSFSRYKTLAYYYVSWTLCIPDMVEERGLPFEKEYELARRILKV